MTESDWLKAKDPEGMLRAVGGRLSPRQWHLLACAVVRRAWDALPEGPAREAVEFAERNPGQTADGPDLQKMLAALQRSAAAGAEAARAEQRRVVLAADPDADPDSFRHADARKTNPSAPLFQAACRAAGNAVQQAGEAAGHAAEAVAALLTLPPGPAQLAQVRERVREASQVQAGAGLHAATALKLKALGDEMADQDTAQNVRLRYAKALQVVQKEEEYAGNRHGDLPEQKQKVDRKALGRFLLDVTGNPFKPYRFEPAWRTSTVVGLARAIYEERAFDRMPILADALLDADCDEEAVLRHCRGTEVHAPEGPAHARGCWVLDLILENEPAFFAAAPLTAPEKPARPAARRPAANPGWASLLDALRAGNPLDPDDQDE